MMNKFQHTRSTFKIFNSNVISDYLREYRNTWIVQNNNGCIQINFLLWFILFTANLIDLLVTYYAFSKGAIEANPAMSVLIFKFGNISLAFVKGALLGMLLIMLPYIKNFLRKCLMFSCSVYVILVFSHIIRF